jgi:hypothetical protein
MDLELVVDAAHMKTDGVNAYRQLFGGGFVVVAINQQPQQSLEKRNASK